MARSPASCLKPSCIFLAALSSRGECHTLSRALHDQPKYVSQLQYQSFTIISTGNRIWHTGMLVKLHDSTLITKVEVTWNLQGGHQSDDSQMLADERRKLGIDSLSVQCMVGITLFEYHFCTTAVNKKKIQKSCCQIRGAKYTQLQPAVLLLKARHYSRQNSFLICRMEMEELR
jgi:hypothetical protein